MIVVDASVLAPALAGDGVDGDQARARLGDSALAAPELIDPEVQSVFRRLHRAEQLPVRRAELAMSDLLDLPLRRVSHRPLLKRCWSLRDHLTTNALASTPPARASSPVVVMTSRASETAGR